MCNYPSLLFTTVARTRHRRETNRRNYGLHEYIQYIYIYVCMYVYSPLFKSEGRIREREIEGLQFPMDNGSLITP